MNIFLTRAWDPILPFVTLLVCPSPSQSARSQCDWGLHTVRGGVDPGDREIIVIVPALLKL